MSVCGAYLLVVVPCLLRAAAVMVMAQPSPPPPRPEHPMPVAIVVTTGVFFFLFLFYLYMTRLRFLLGGGGDEDGTPPPQQPASRRGLDQAVLATFPMVPYADMREHKVGGGALECAVCLTAFDEGENLRLLPHCSHAFHPECIGPWLEAWTTCPLCRADLELPHAAAVAIAAPAHEDMKEEAVELENLRGERRAARSHSTRHSMVLLEGEGEQCACELDRERFTLRLPEHVREQVLRRCCGGGGGRCEGGGGDAERRI